jgi:hypothetical protein
MKRLLIGLLALGSISVFGNVHWQMEHILGDYDFPSRDMVVKIKQQSEKSIKIYYCNRKDFFTLDGQCLYFAIEIGTYNKYLDGFCIASVKNSGKACSNGMQTDFSIPDYSTDLLYKTDPLNQYGVSRYTNRGKKLD